MTDESGGVPSTASAELAQGTRGRTRRMLQIAVGLFALALAIVVSYLAHRSANQEAVLSAESAASARSRSDGKAATSSSATFKRYAVQGPSTKAMPFIGQKAALTEAVEYGMIETLNKGNSGTDAGRR